MLASPFVGVSNDALVLVRAEAQRQPVFRALERPPARDLSEGDRRLLLAFKQRYERLLEVAALLARAPLRARRRRARLRPRRARAPRRPPPVREPAQARPAGPVVRGAQGRGDRGLRAVRRGAGDGGGEGIRRGPRRRRAPTRSGSSRSTPPRGWSSRSWWSRTPDAAVLPRRTSSPCPTGGSASRSRTRRRGHASAPSPTRTSGLTGSAPSRPSGCASTTSR